MSRKRPYLTLKNVIDEIIIRTRFSREDIELVLKTYGQVARESLMGNVEYPVPLIGTLTWSQKKPITQRFPANGKHYKSRVRDIPGFQTTILRMEPEWSLTLRRVSEFREGEGNPMYFGGANDSYPDGVQANTVREWTLSQCENNKRLKTARTNFQKVLAKKRVNKLSKEERTRASCLNGTSQGKPVLQLTRLDNVPIAGYYSQWEAEDYTGVSKNSISQVCMGQGKSTGGFAWRFASKEFIESEEWARLVEVGRQRSELTKNKYVKPCNRKVVPPPE